MIKDYLKENQPLFYRIIENEFNLKKNTTCILTCWK